MSLEEDIARQLDETVRRDPAVLEIITGQRDPTDLSYDDFTNIMIRMLGAHRAAILTIASEIDNLRSGESG